jgi:ketosteroid isomerase-like protein
MNLTPFSLLLGCLGWITADAAASDIASRVEIEQLVRRSLLAWESGDEREFLDTAHPGILFAFPGERTDAAGALGVFRYWREHYRDTRVYLHWMLVEGSRFAVEYQFATTNNETGKRTAMGTVAIGEVREGRIALLKEYTDGRVSRLQEAGEIPLEEGEEPFPWPRVERDWPWRKTR